MSSKMLRSTLQFVSNFPPPRNSLDYSKGRVYRKKCSVASTLAEREKGNKGSDVGFAERL